MATLQEIGVNGIAGMAPIPVLKHAIDNYLVHSDFMALQEFVPIGYQTDYGNYKASFRQYGGVDKHNIGKYFRQFGVDFESEASNFDVVEITLQILGGKFPVDRTMVTAFSTGDGKSIQWVEEQIGQKINGIIEAFTYMAFNGAGFYGHGNNELTYREFLIDRGQNVIEEPLVLENGLTSESAIQVEKHFYKIRSLMGRMPNVCYTNKEGEAIAQSVNSLRNRGVEALDIGNKKFSQIMGMPIVVIDDYIWEAMGVYDKTPFIFAYIDKQNGIRWAVPRNTQLIDIKKPLWVDGEAIKGGSVEMMTAQIIPSDYCLAMGYIVDKSGEGGGGGGIPPVTEPEVTVTVLTEEEIDEALGFIELDGTDIIDGDVAFLTVDTDRDYFDVTNAEIVGNDIVVSIAFDEGGIGTPDVYTANIDGIGEQKYLPLRILLDPPGDITNYNVVVNDETWYGND